MSAGSVILPREEKTPLVQKAAIGAVAQILPAGKQMSHAFLHGSARAGPRCSGPFSSMNCSGRLSICRAELSRVERQEGVTHEDAGTRTLPA